MKKVAVRFKAFGAVVVSRRRTQRNTALLRKLDVPEIYQGQYLARGIAVYHTQRLHDITFDRSRKTKQRGRQR